MGSDGIAGRLAPLLDALPCGAALVSRDGRIVKVNVPLCAMMGRPASEIVGATLNSIYAGDGEARAHVDQVLREFDEPHDGELYLPRADGTRLPVLSTARRLDPPHADLRLVTMVDLSQQKQTEDDLRRQYEIVAQLGNTFLGTAEDLKQYSEQLEARVRERTAELREANLDAIYMLAVACEAKDEDTGHHVRRIREYAAALARELGFDEREAESIGYSAVLHDVGKLHVPDHILKKPGALTEEERIIVQQHTVAGERILSEKPFFQRARSIARAHHENWDGSGYPDMTAGRAIPVEARIVHLADVFDALTTPRVYKLAWTSDDAAAVIRESRGRMFDPEIVLAFESLYTRGALKLPEAPPLAADSSSMG